MLCQFRSSPRWLWTAKGAVFFFCVFFSLWNTSEGRFLPRPRRRANSRRLVLARTAGSRSVMSWGPCFNEFAFGRRCQLASHLLGSGLELVGLELGRAPFMCRLAALSEAAVARHHQRFPIQRKSRIISPRSPVSSRTAVLTNGKLCLCARFFLLCFSFHPFRHCTFLSSPAREFVCF